MADQRFYYETRSLGKWWPRTSSDRPSVKNIGGVDREIGVSSTVGRPIRAITEINDGLTHLGLDALRHVYSPDGKFYKK